MKENILNIKKLKKNTIINFEFIIKYFIITIILRRYCTYNYISKIVFNFLQK